MMSDYTLTQVIQSTRDLLREAEEEYDNLNKLLKKIPPTMAQRPRQQQDRWREIIGSEMMNLNILTLIRQSRRWMQRTGFLVGMGAGTAVPSVYNHISGDNHGANLWLLGIAAMLLTSGIISGVMAMRYRRYQRQMVDIFLKDREK